ncbi:MAG TPA: cyclic nucleotide-binding domain-containing protein, partial [Solirubrobacteraceae bacterium]
EGELRVVVDGTEVRRLEAGGFFGEIALLRGVPRTATVTATAPAHLMALEREDFLTAVTGHARAGGAADAVVESRLSVSAAAP